MSESRHQSESGGVAQVSLPGYVDLVEIGHGGFGTVYRALDVALGRLVAVKVLAATANVAARQGFAREGSAMSRVSGHPNIVPVHAVGITPGGQPYLVMSLMARGSVADLLDRTGRLPWPESVRLTIRIAGALETTHRAGIIHRDIKPANILLSDYGEPLLTDFGNSRIDGTSDSGQICATLAHAAPEMLERAAPAVASDVYSLGSTLFTFIHGRPPFELSEGEEWVSLCRRIASNPVPDLRPHGVPSQICAAIEQAMAKSPRDRPASAAEFGSLLQGGQRAAKVATTEMAIANSYPQTLTESVSKADRTLAGERHFNVPGVPQPHRLGWFRPRPTRRRGTLRIGESCCP